ncbi:MAG: immunity 53 family protein [Candidatus Rhabdochlamydia sp.]
MKDDFLWLQQWYQSHCNGDWEHNNGIQLSTLDNPGWTLDINLKDTKLENKNFQKINDIYRSEEDWIMCTVRDTKFFDAACGVENLPTVLKVFRYWIENESFDFALENTKITENSMEDDDDDFLWLQEWYQSYCNGDWEHGCGVQLRTTDNPSWSLTIDLEATDLEYANLPEIKIDRSEENWIFCEVKEDKFEARCGIGNLLEILKIFRNWAIENEPSENHEYTWDDYVIVKEDAPKISCPGTTGTICDMWEIKREGTAKKYHSELGDWIYLVEFKHCTTIRVAGRFLEKHQKPQWLIEKELSRNNEYNWKDAVIVKENAPEISCPGIIGIVWEMWKIITEEVAKEYHSELGDWIYLVKLKKGKKIYVAGRFLEGYSEQ